MISPNYTIPTPTVSVLTSIYIIWQFKKKTVYVIASSPDITPRSKYEKSKGHPRSSCAPNMVQFRLLFLNLSIYLLSFWYFLESIFNLIVHVPLTYNCHLLLFLGLYCIFWNLNFFISGEKCVGTCLQCLMEATHLTTVMKLLWDFTYVPKG